MTTPDRDGYDDLPPPQDPYATTTPLGGPRFAEDDLPGFAPGRADYGWSGAGGGSDLDAARPDGAVAGAGSAARSQPGATPAVDPDPTLDDPTAGDDPTSSGAGAAGAVRQSAARADDSPAQTGTSAYPVERRRRYVPDPQVYEAPPRRTYDPGRWLRSLAGVDERLLRQVWFERARHTALGGIILGTALIAGFSMWMAINQLLGAWSWLALVPALIWFVFIISLDRALVSTMVGQGRRWGAFLMRLALSVMFGFIIAEPLTIKIFETAIEQHIRDERSQQLADLRGALVSCNTKEIATSAAQPPPGCAGFLLSFDATPVAAEQKLAAKQADEATLAATVDADNKELARLTELARRECAGETGPGLTGVRGYGRDCLDRNRDVDTFKANHPLKANADRLARLRTEITTLSDEISASQAGFESTRDRLIEARVQEARDHQGPIGLLERMDALHELASTSWALFFSTWAVRLFFILADCLPVVVKFSAGTSQYDRVVAAQAAHAQRRYERDLQLLDDEAQAHIRKHKADLDFEVQQHRADTTMRRDDAVRRVEGRMLRSGR